MPANSVGTKQLKNGAVTATKLDSSVLTGYLKYGATLPSGVTETGVWGFGTYDSFGGGAFGYPVMSFAVPLAAGLDGDHTVYVSGSSATHCSGPGQADAGYLCVYQTATYNAQTPASGDIYNPEANIGTRGTGAHGWQIYLNALIDGEWLIQGSYAVTAP